MSSIVITSSKKRIKRFFGGTSSTDMFFEGGTVAPIGRDVLSHPYFQEFVKGNFTSISHGNGGFAQQYGVPNDTLHIGGLGNGWYAIEPRDCSVMAGELCADFRVGGKPVDFWNSHMILRKMLGAENYIIGNIYKGDLAQLYRQIDATIPQKTIYIQFGEEITTREFGNGANYAAECYKWQEEIERQYPEQRFRFVFYCRTLWDSEPAKLWAEQIASVRPIDKKKWCVNQYCHAFRFWTLTGDLESDLAQIEHAAKVLLPAWSQAIIDSPFNGMKVFIGQVSTNEGAYSPTVTKGFEYLVNFYARMNKFWIDELIAARVKYIGQCYIAGKSWINKQLQTALDFQYVAVMNRLYIKGLHAMTVSELDPGVDIYGGFKGGIVRLVIQNRSGREIPLPATFTFDGVEYPFKVISSVCRVCADQRSTESTEFDITKTMVLPGLCMSFFEIEREELLPL